MAAAVTVAGLRPRLVAIWLVLLALLAVIVILELAERQLGRETPDETVWLLPAPLEQIGAVEIAHAGRVHRFERDSDGQWLRHRPHRHAKKPHVHKADPETARRTADTLAAFARTRIERRLPFDAKAAQYGLGAAATLVVLYPVGGGEPLAKYAIGDIAPDTFSRYVHKAGSGEVVTIPAYQVDNLLALIAERPG